MLLTDHDISMFLLTLDPLCTDIKQSCVPVRAIFNKIKVRNRGSSTDHSKSFYIYVANTPRQSKCREEENSEPIS